jgi:hypothetical protein
MDVLHVDCASCVARGPAACGDCVISVLLGAPPQGVDLDDAEQAALSALADQGLVPPLRLVPGARPARAEPGRLGGRAAQGTLGWQDYA